MGVENNECIIATTWNKEAVAEVKRWIDKYVPEGFQLLFHISDCVVNNKQTIIMAPDGSKKGWDVAIEGERIRDMFIKKLESFDYEDGSNPFDFVEVSYGEYGQKVLRGNCDNMYDEEERDDGV